MTYRAPSTIEQDLAHARTTARSVFDALRAMDVRIRAVGLQHGVFPQESDGVFFRQNGPFLAVGEHPTGHVALAFAAQRDGFLNSLRQGVAPFVDRMVHTLPLLQGPLGSCSFHLDLGPSGWLNPAGTLTVNGVRVTERIGVFVERAAHLGPATVFSQRPGRQIAAASESEATILTEIASR